MIDAARCDRTMLPIRTVGRLLATATVEWKGTCRSTYRRCDHFVDEPPIRPPASNAERSKQTEKVNKLVASMRTFIKIVADKFES